jgi:hypothetical protein
MQQAYGTVPANEDAPLVRDDGASSDEFSAVEAGSVTADSTAAACPTPMADDPFGAEKEGEPMVVCPYLFEELDVWLTQPGSNSPTLFFRAAQAACVAWGLALLAGTFATPGLQDAWEASDPLLALGLVLLFISIGVLVPLRLDELRTTIRGGPADNGRLTQLGAGSALIPSGKAKALRKLPMPAGNPMMDFKNWVIPLLFCGPSLCTGWGLQSPAQNRFTAAIMFMKIIAAGPLRQVGPVTLRTATALIGARIEAITQAAEVEAQTAGQDEPPAVWERTVVEPCRQMIGEMRLLSEGWGRAVVLGWAGQLANAGGNLCVALSPCVAELLGKLGEHIGAPWLVYALQGMLIFRAVVLTPHAALAIAAAPAEVSTAADMLKEKLNDIRISDFSRETDDKISILERALANCNDGQGVGFHVMGTVIDKKMLNRIALKLYGLIAAAVPVVLAYSLFSAHKSDGLGPCDALTPDQVGALVAKLSAVSAAGGDGNCSVANLTIAEVLNMPM